LDVGSGGVWLGRRMPLVMVSTESSSESDSSYSFPSSSSSSSSFPSLFIFSRPV
jgi:hypothetical protein